MESTSWLDKYGRSIMHPMLSRNFDDGLSLLLLRASTSLKWGVYALGALITFGCLPLLDEVVSHTGFGSVLEPVLIVYAVTGVLANVFVALAHSAKQGDYRRVIVMSFFWPLSFLYTWRILIRKLSSKGGSRVV